ncbi:MAG: hypothetical protein ACI9YL_000499 [Luteibaculaceae bacterium]|jgi:hypothetical protein
MKVGFFIISIMILIFDLKSQDSKLEGLYYNGYGTDLELKEDGSFWIRHIPRERGCNFEDYSSSGHWRIRNGIIDLISLENVKRNSGSIRINSRDSLSPDSIYVKVISALNKSPVPFASIVLINGSNHYLESVNTSFDGVARFKNQHFSTMKISTVGFSPITMDQTKIQKKLFRNSTGAWWLKKIIGRNGKVKI